MTDDSERGLYQKYRVFKVPHPGSEVIDPSLELTGPFFVLSFGSTPARVALSSYALAVRGSHPKLCEDIFAKLGEPTEGMFNLCNLCDPSGMITYWVHSSHIGGDEYEVHDSGWSHMNYQLTRDHEAVPKWGEVG